jgi:hypothetical protein
MNHLRLPYLFSCVTLAALLSISLPAYAQQAIAGFLKVKANPGRAGVFVDGKYLGPAANFRWAQKYSVPAGEHELLLRDPRYQEYKTTVKIDAGRTTTVSQTLQPRELSKPPYGRLKLSGFEKYASVFVNEAYMGHTDEFNGPNQGLMLNPGDYNLKVSSRAGDTLLEQKFALQQDQVLTVKAK